MRFLILMPANKDSEAGVIPTETMLSEMGKFNEELVKAGIMLAGEGLHPTSKGARIRFSGAKPTVIDGPFTESKELIAGFWLWQVRSKEEAIEWVKRIPNPTNENYVIEIRQIFEEETSETWWIRFPRSLRPSASSGKRKMRAARRRRIGGRQGRAAEAGKFVRSVRLLGTRPLHLAHLGGGGVIWSRDGYRNTPRDRNRVADRIRQAHRRPHARGARRWTR